MKRLVLVAVVAALVGSGVAFGRERSCALARDARACARACEESVCKKGADAEEPKISVFASFIRNIAKQCGISKTEAADLSAECPSPAYGEIVKIVRSSVGQLA